MRIRTADLLITNELILDHATYCELANYGISKGLAVKLHLHIVECSRALLRVLYSESVRRSVI